MRFLLNGFRPSCFFVFATAIVASTFSSWTTAQAQLSVSLTGNSLLDSNALQLPGSGNFSRTINGRPFQQDAIVSHGGFQYTAWYNNGANDENVFFARRSLSGGQWQSFNTGFALENGDATASSPSRRWDSHNSIAFGISGDGRVHLTFDQHVDEFRYVTTAAGAATTSNANFNAGIFQNERNSLNVGAGGRIPQVTYPRFTNVGDDLVFNYRIGSSDNGNLAIASYDSDSGQWTNPSTFVSGQQANPGESNVYVDINGNNNITRNAYLNGLDSDPSGRLHATFTWRERREGPDRSNGNRDFNYAYSDDQGLTWRNNDGQLISQSGSPITTNSQGIEVRDLDINQAFINQQGQVVDLNGGVHALVHHRIQDDPRFAFTEGDSRFGSQDSAYHHYYRDPDTGQWQVVLVPTLEGVTPGENVNDDGNVPDAERVGDRPRIAADADGNVFGVFRARNGDLVVAGAARNDDGFNDWEVLYRDSSANYQGTPQIDQSLLFSEGILSVLIQEQAQNLEDTPTGSDLRVFDFQIASITSVPEPSSIAVLLALTPLALRRRRLAH